MGVLSPGAWVHCGRVFSAAEIADIRRTVAWLPGLGRRELAATLCAHVQWYTVMGTAKAHACREFLERLETAGLVTLPPLQVARRPRCRCWTRRHRFRVPWPRSARCAWNRCAPTPRRWRSGMRRSPAGIRWATRAPSATGYVTSSPRASSAWAACCWRARRARWRCVISGSVGTPRRVGNTGCGSSTTAAS